MGTSNIIAKLPQRLLSLRIIFCSFLFEICRFRLREASSGRAKENPGKKDFRQKKPDSKRSRRQ